MLLWQRQNSDFLKHRLLFYSVVCHLVACFFLLFFYKEQRHKLLLDLSLLHPSQAQVKLLPLSMAKPIGQQYVGTKKGKKGGTKLSATFGKKKEVVKKSVTSLASLAVTKNPKIDKKIKTKKNVLVAKKNVQSKTATVSKKIEKIVEKKQQPVSEKVVKHEEQNSAPSDKTSSVLEKKMEKSFEQEPAAKSQEYSVADQALGNEYIYLTRQELDAFQISQKLQECLFEAWTIPVGIPATAVCEVLVTIGWDGAIVATEYTKKSTILLYDLSVEEALEQVQFPHEVWGKQITVIFKP